MRLGLSKAAALVDDTLVMLQDDLDSMRCTGHLDTEYTGQGADNKNSVLQGSEHTLDKANLVRQKLELEFVLY